MVASLVIVINVTGIERRSKPTEEERNRNADTGHPSSVHRTQARPPTLSDFPAYAVNIFTMDDKATALRIFTQCQLYLRMRLVMSARLRDGNPRHALRLTTTELPESRNYARSRWPPHLL